MSKTMGTTLEFELFGAKDCLSLDVIVEYVKEPEIAPSTDGRAGPPLEPKEPAHLEIENIKVIDSLGKEDEYMTSVLSFLLENGPKTWIRHIEQLVEDEEHNQFFNKSY